jgi:hypothetical protein
MKKVCSLEFYSISDLFKGTRLIYPHWGLIIYQVCFRYEVGKGVPELKHVAMLESPDKRSAWIYKIEGEVCLIIYEVEPFNNHKQYQMAVVKRDERILGSIELGFVRLFENQVLTLTNEGDVNWLVGKLLNKDWLIRFPSGSQAGAGY